jgi:membrane fusion protein
MTKQNPNISSENSLFRKEVMHKRKGNYFGKTLVTAPISFTYWSVGIFLLTALIVLFLYFGEYSRRQEVHGVLLPNTGLINIYPSKPGVVVSKLVKPGEEVKKGQILYVISTEQHTLMAESLNMQQIMLLKKQIEIQFNKIDILTENLERNTILFNKGIISNLEYQKHNEALLSANGDLYDLEYRLSQVQGDNDYVIRAPADGTISVLTNMIGDRVTEQKILGSIIPCGSKLQGVLYVPTDSIGFIKIGQKVLLKYQAFPYQQFGLYEAVIEHIDKSTLSSEDTKMSINLNVPFYRVIVNLQQYKIKAHGHDHSLMPGMLFEALILSEKRKIWQWIMSPIFSIKGNLSS